MHSVEDFFDNQIPSLPFRLAIRPLDTINIMTLKRAIDLSRSFAGPFGYYRNSKVEEFLTKIVEFNNESKYGPNYQHDPATQAILDSYGYQCFLFYLTVYDNKLEWLLIHYASEYLEKIGITFENSVKVEYYPCMYDPDTLNNDYAIAFGGNIKKLMLYCRLMHENFLQLYLPQGEYRISAVDILGQVSRSDPLPEGKDMIDLRYRRDVSHLVRSVF